MRPAPTYPIIILYPLNDNCFGGLSQDARPPPGRGPAEVHLLGRGLISRFPAFCMSGVEKAEPKNIPFHRSSVLR
jgi:hypothetical protein